MYAKLEDGLIVRYPYTLLDLRQDNPNVSFAANLTDDVLALFGVVRIIPNGPTEEYDPITQYPVEGIPVKNSVGFWVQTWTIANYPTEEADARMQTFLKETELEYTAKLEEYYDKRAQERRYDNRFTCALRAGYAGPFQAEGLAFATWMDNCNAHAYEVLADVLNGIRKKPTMEELIAEMPVLVWPS